MVIKLEMEDDVAQILLESLAITSAILRQFENCYKGEKKPCQYVRAQERAVTQLGTALAKSKRVAAIARQVVRGADMVDRDFD